MPEVSARKVRVYQVRVDYGTLHRLALHGAGKAMSVTVELLLTDLLRRSPAPARPSVLQTPIATRLLLLPAWLMQNSVTLTLVSHL